MYINATHVTFNAAPIIRWQSTIQNDLVITIKDKTYEGGWSNGRQPKDGLSIVADETFTIKVEESVDTVFGFAVSSGDTSVILSWEGPSDPTTNLWQYRYKEGSGSWRGWTDIPGGGLVLEHRVEGLTNDIAHTFQLRHFSASGGGESGEETVTPEWQYQPLLRHEFFTPDSGDGHRGYLKGSHGTSVGGRRTTIDDAPEFYIDGTYYTVTEIRENGTDVFFDTEPQMDLDVLNELSMVVTDSGDTTRKTYYGGWTEESGKFKQPRQHQFNNDKEFVTITRTPQSLTAAPINTGMVLSWAGPDGGAVITKWQYRIETGSTWGSWTDVPGGDGTARRVRITGLTNGTSYGFQIRFVYTDTDGDSQNGVASKEVTATANQYLLDTTMTVGGANNFFGFNNENGEGSMSDRKFTYKGTEYTIDRLNISTTHDFVYLLTSPAISAADMNELQLTFSTKTYPGSWVKPSGDTLRQARDGLTLTLNASVPVKIEVGDKGGNPGDSVQGLTATPVNAGMVLNWTGPDGGGIITKWEHRTKTGTTWSDWTEVAGGGAARRVKVTDLNNGT